MDKMKKVKKKRKMAKNLTLPHWDSNPRFEFLREIRSIAFTVLKKSRLYYCTKAKGLTVYNIYCANRHIGGCCINCQKCPKYVCETGNTNIMLSPELKLDIANNNSSK